MARRESVPLPAVLDTCGCNKRRGFGSGRHSHYSDCLTAIDFTAGQKAADQVRYGRSTQTRPGDASAAFLAGWDRNIDWADGVSHQAISWDYPLHIDTRYGSAVDIRIDPVEWFTKYLRSYVDFVPWEDLGFEEPWEKPLAFLYNQIQEDREPHGTFGGHDRSFGSDDSISSIRYRWAWEDNREWSEQDTRTLHQRLGIEDANGDPIELAPDPQGQMAPLPQTVDDGILPLAGPGSAYTDRYIANVHHAMTYLREAAAIHDRAMASEVDLADLQAGLTGEQAEIATFVVSMAKAWGP